MPIDRVDNLVDWNRAQDTKIRILEDVVNDLKDKIAELEQDNRYLHISMDAIAHTMNQLTRILGETNRLVEEKRRGEVGG